MNKNGKKNISTSVIAIVSVAFVTLLFLLFLSFDTTTMETMLMIYVASIGFVCCVTLLLKSIIDNFIVPYINRRNAALRALGKEGIRIVHKDEVARLAYKGIYSLLKGKIPEAEDYLQQSLAQSDVRQNQTFCVEWLIRLYESTENNAKLMWGYRTAVELAPESPDSQSRLGHAYYNVGQLDKAIYHFEQALRYDANNGYAYFSLSKIYLIRDDMKKAYEMLEQLKKVNEHHPLCYVAFADYYAMNGEKEKAEEAVKKAELCGVHEPEELNRRINAMLSFHTTEWSEKDLPAVYYRRVEKEEDKPKEE